MVIEFVSGHSLEFRLNQMITARRGLKQLKIVSQHIHNATINGVPFRKKLEQLIRSQVKVIIIINKRTLKNDPTEQEFVSDLIENLGVTIMFRRSVHAKMVLLTGATDSLLVSSLNISNTAIHENKEAGIFIENERCDLISNAQKYISEIQGKV